TITLQAKNKPLEDVLKAIGKQSKHFFFYKYDDVKEAPPVTVNLNKVTLEEALRECLKNQPFEYEVDNKTIVINKKIVPAARTIQQQSSVSGRVLDESGQPLAGATVRIKGTNNTAVSDGDGNFTLQNIPTEAILEIVYTGYKSQEIAIAGRTQIQTTLSLDNQSLNEVVVVGYGTQQRKDITGAISSLEAEKIEKQVAVSLDNAMAGQLAGVQVSQATGAPGGGSSVRIRGAGSLSAGNDPLYVIDGFPVTNDYNQ